MTGLYSPINRLMEQVTRPKGTGAEYMTELAKKPGYKPAEAEDRDLQALMALPQMQRAEFMEKLKGQANKFPLKMRELGEGQTHHETYTLPGGENYREILLHTPDTKREELKKKHSEIDDLMNSPTTTTEQYKKLYATRVALADQYIHGVEGSFPGNPIHFGGAPNILASIMAKDRITPEGKKILHLEEIQSDWHQQGREHGYHPKDLYAQIRAATAEKRMMDRYLKEADEDSGDMAYGEYRRMVDDQQAATEKLDRLRQLKEEGVPHGPHAKDWHELALKAMIQHAAENGYDQIATNHGQIMAQRYGLDPKGMQGFYDKMVPTFLNKFGKKHGVQVQQGSVPIVSTPAQHHGMTEDQFQAQSPDEQQHMVRQHAYAYQGAKTEAPVHTFDITPGMREDVLKNGIPRYNEGGAVKPMHELFHGTNKEFKSFDKDKSHIVNGVWLTQDKNYANWMADRRAEQEKGTVPRVLRVNAYHNNPMHFDILAEGKKLAEQIGEPAPKNAYEAQELLSGGMGWNAVVDDLAHEAKTKKHDSLIIHNFNDNWHSDPNQTTTAHIVFDPDKLKIIDQQKYAEGGAVKEDVPRETVKAYKMFKVDKKQPGKLFPLFVDTQTPVEMDKWVAAKEGEKSDKNTKKVKSKIGDLAYRPGWHAGDLPIATHIGEKDAEQKAEIMRIKALRNAFAETLGGDKAAKEMAKREHPYPEWTNAPRLRNANHMWAEVEMPNDVDWQSEATKRGYNDKGKLIASQAHITDQLPKGGHYRYKTNSNMLGNWLIGGAMKVNRILPDEEVAAINSAAGAADLPRSKAMNQKAFGFSEGGAVAPEEWLAEEHVNHKAKGGSIKPVGHAVVKEKVTISPNMDAMQYELMGVKHFTKKVK